jgi:hypothetical protein
MMSGGRGANPGALDRAARREEAWRGNGWLYFSWLPP